jgi:hypothetical protein
MQMHESLLLSGPIVGVMHRQVGGDTLCGLSSIILEAVRGVAEMVDTIDTLARVAG